MVGLMTLCFSKGSSNSISFCQLSVKLQVKVTNKRLDLRLAKLVESPKRKVLIGWF